MLGGPGVKQVLRVILVAVCLLLLLTLLLSAFQETRWFPHHASSVANQYGTREGI